MIEMDESNEELLKELQELRHENSTLKALYEKDLQERHLIEADLRQSEARFRHLFQDIENISVQGYDLDGTTQYWNRASEKLYGYSAQEAIGQKLVDLIIPLEMKELVRNSIKEMAATGQPIPASELSLVRKDGSRVSVFSSHAIINIPGRKQELFCIDINLTKLKQAEESDRLKSAFLANMSHEIRTPMNGILGFADLLKSQQLTGDKQQEYIQIIEQSGMRMLNILNDIIDISRIEAGHMKLEIIESNINEQCEYIYTFFKPEVEEKGLKFSLKNSLPTQEAFITTDREKLFAILTNLVKNAIKYTPTGSIELGYRLTSSPTQKKELQFYVKDTGIGIPKDRHEAIFKRFIQSDIHNKMAHQGAGLGLSITKAYVEMLGGQIGVESEEGIGSTFYFTLPYNAIQTKKPIHNDLPPDREEHQGKNLKILIVEDDKISKMLIDLAVKTIGSDILEAGTGVEAIEACRNHPDIDLILMDMQMPEMNGYEATRQIRQFNNEVIIIAQTANGLNNNREKMIAAGCNDYITKPINKAELNALIQKYFNNSCNYYEPAIQQSGF